MTTRLARPNWRAIETLFDAGVLGTCTDSELLDRFRTDRGTEGHEAFRFLVERHGPMVLAVCHRLIPDHHEAEDAFQATFLVLARRRHGIWVRDSLGPWLHGVARRIALRARRRAMARGRLQTRFIGDVADRVQSEPATRSDEQETERAIHEAVASLPEILREPIILCALRGLTYLAAARELGVSEPTLRGRLGRARRRLAERLRERGVASSWMVTASSNPMAPTECAVPVVPPSLTRSTVQHAMSWSTSKGLGIAEKAVPASITALARGVLRLSLLRVCTTVLGASLVAAGLWVSAVWAKPRPSLVIGSRASTAAQEQAGSANRDGSHSPKAEAQPARVGTRLITGRATDAEGRPIRDARVSFGPQKVLAPFEESAMVVTDVDGRFRIELSGFPIGSETPSATGPLRYFVLAPGFRDTVGNVDAGTVPVALDVRLTAAPWPKTAIRLVDRDAKPVSGAKVTLRMQSPGVWSDETSDSDGRCAVQSSPGLAFSITVERPGFLPVRFGSRGTADEPTSFTVPLYRAIEGQVIDESGKPLPDIQIGRLIAPNYDAGLDKPSDTLEMCPLIGSKQPAVSSIDGRFSLAPMVDLRRRSGEFKIWPMVLCFADRALRRVHFLRVDMQGPREAYTITLRPARRVQIAIEHKVTLPSGPLNSWWELFQLADDGRADGSVFVMQGLVKRHGQSKDLQGGEWIEAYWPVGKYRLELHSADPVARQGTEEAQTEVTVSSGDEPLALPPIKMNVLPQRSLVGQPAPEIEAKDLNTGATVKLADYRGKVVILDFWGYWCGPCLGAMPALIEAHGTYRGKPVVIIALHDQSIQTRDAYDRNLAEVKRQAWNNRELPFVVALDHPDPELGTGDAPNGRGKSIKRYQIRAFPTTFVIDQEGKVAGTVEVREKGRLDTLVNRLLDKTGAR
jgi:RNA polymerase sigma factor (sigma-70 family)